MLQALLPAAHLHLARGDHDLFGALEAAIDQLPATGVPVLRATLLLDLVRLHDSVGKRAAAKVEAGRAAAALAG